MLDKNINKSFLFYDSNCLNSSIYPNLAVPKGLITLDKYQNTLRTGRSDNKEQIQLFIILISERHKVLKIDQAVLIN